MAGFVHSSLFNCPLTYCESSWIRRLRPTKAWTIVAKSSALRHCLENWSIIAISRSADTRGVVGAAVTHAAAPRRLDMILDRFATSVFHRDTSNASHQPWNHSLWCNNDVVIFLSVRTWAGKRKWMEFLILRFLKTVADDKCDHSYRNDENLS